MRDSIESMAPNLALSPVARAAGAANGSGIDRLGFEALVASIQSGATSGTPTSFTLDAKLQDSDDNSTFADVTGATMTQIITIDTLGKITLDLRGLKRYVRVVLTTVFVGGTSPTLLSSAAVNLMEPVKKPVA